MRFKQPLSFVFALLLGVIAGVAIMIGYGLPGFAPTADIFMYIVTSPVGLAVLKSTSGKAGVMLAITLRAFVCSFVVGLIAGVVLHKIRYQRVFCYSALLLPFINSVLGYFKLSATSLSTPELIPALQEQFSELLWVNLSVYGWYFLALYASYAISSRFLNNPLRKKEALKPQVI